MPVINVPANQGVHLPAGTIPGLMHVYCIDTTATFGISIQNPPPPWVWHFLTAGHMLTFQVDGLPVWIYNNGPSRIQLLSTLELEGISIDEIGEAITLSETEVA